MRVLVTGGSGFVGRAVCERLMKAHEVINFDRRPPERPQVRYVCGDILNSAHLIDAMAGVDAVVHLAAIPNPSMTPTDVVMEVNVMGTQRVLEAAAHGSPRRVVVASSDAAYGFVFGNGRIQPEYIPVDEVHPTRPLDAYGLSKVLKEEICRRYTRATGLETVCLRYCWVWSESHYANLQSLADAPERFAGQLWGYVDVRDVAQAVEKALVAPDITHATLVISAERTFQSLPSLELARRLLPPTVAVRDAAWFGLDPHRTLLDWRRAHHVIGYQPEYDCWEQAGLKT